MTRDRGRMTAILRSVRAAFAFFTRLPVGGFPYAPADWAGAPAHFPLVGLTIGAAVACVDRALAPAGSWPAAVLAIGASIALTGALHEDGLADTCDALGGGSDRARVLEILKDSRIGAFGGCAIVLSVLVRAALIERIGPHGYWALPIAGCAARVGPVWQMVALPYVSGTASKSRELVRAGWRQVFAATGWLVASGASAVAAGGISPGRLVAAAVAAATVTFVTARVYLRRAGGVTGDFLGATEQMGEVVTLFALAWHAP